MPARLVEGCGIAWALVTALVVAWVEHHFEWTMIGRMWWGFFPIGAGLLGTLAAVGFLLGTRWQRVPPGRWLQMKMAVVLFATFFLVHWLGYQWLQVDGIRIATRVDFLTYLKVALAGTEFVVGRAVTTGPLGAMGYVLAAIQLLGFCLGAAVIRMMMVDHGICARCGRTFDEPGLSYGRRWAGTEAYADFREKLLARTQVDEDYLALVESPVRPDDEEGATRGTQWAHQHCRHCGLESVVETPRQRGEQEWEDVPTLRRVLPVSSGVDVAASLRRAKEAAWRG